MSAEPTPLPALQPAAPPGLDRAVSRCLAKDPDERWQTARDLRQALVWILEGGSQSGASAAVPASTKPGATVAWVVAGVFAVAFLVLGAFLLRQEKPVPRPIRLSVNTPEGTALTSGGRPAISPDGEKILFAAAKGDQILLYLHNLITGETQAIAGVEGSLFAYWSFDSRSFLVPRGKSVARVNLNGCPIQPLPIRLTLDSGNVLVTDYASASWGPEGIALSAGGDLQWLQPDGSGARVLRAPRSSEVGLNYPTLIPEAVG
jgi:hypothetical protein